MARIVLGIGTSHSPMLSLTAEQWPVYAEGDFRHQELVFPPKGIAMSYDEGLNYVPAAVKEKPLTQEVFKAQVDACQRGIAELAKTLQAAKPDITVIISDDQDEWFYEDNMPMFSVYWGDTVPLIPRAIRGYSREPEILEAIAKGYGDREMDIPVAKDLGRHIIEYMVEHDFDVSHFTYTKEQYGGKVARRYPTAEGELDTVRETEEREQGLPHGFAFVIKRLFDNNPSMILPIFENTCYPPNQPTPRRSYRFGQAVAEAIKSWDSDARVAVVGSGGLSHFVTDEELDRSVLTALEKKEAETLMSLPRERLYSAASETQNWVALGGVMENTALQMELIEYVPVYRTPAGTGGGWAFARWQ
ncbi:MAG: hypothetical protein WD533_08595 [Dehalococcoidia bacterium]